MLFIILIIAILSISQILRLYFSYEDFSLLYGLQFPNDAHSIFIYPGIFAYRSSQPFLTPQFLLFDYNPFWYYLVSFILFLLVLFFFYRFIRVLHASTKDVAFFATIIMASGYLGIEALTWNVGGGQIHLGFLITALITLICAVAYLRTRKIASLLLMTIALFISVYFFQFRSYMMFIWLPLVITLQAIDKSQRLPFKVYLFACLLLAPLLLLFSQSFKFVLGRVAHLNLNMGELLMVFLENLGNLFFPSDLFVMLGVTPDKIGQVLGVITFSGLLFLPLYLFKNHRKVAPLSIFFSTAIIFSLVVIMGVIAFTGQIPTVWPSSHRFYIVLLPFVSGYLAVILSILSKKIRLPLVIFIVLIHVWASNLTIHNRWEGLSRHLRYFYETVTTVVPRVDNDTVLLTTLTRPYPPGPFVSGSDAGSAHFLAGFYGKRFDDFNLATEPMEAVKLILDKNLAPEDIYAFDYKRDDIVEETEQVRKILALGQKVNLGKDFEGAQIKLDNLAIPASTPVFVKLRVAATLPDAQKDARKLAGEKMTNSNYFNLYFEQEEKRKNMIAHSESIPLGNEHDESTVIDGRYDTTWIPEKWGEGGATITVELGIPHKAYRIAWASSRVAPWEFRSPSEYEVYISLDGVNFTLADGASNVASLKTGDFFTTALDGQEIKYVRLVVKKTRGGWTPAIDEIEVFENPIETKDLENYFAVKEKPADYFNNREMAMRYYNKVLNQKIPVEINWKVDNDGGYLAGQERKFNIEGLGVAGDYMVFLPKTGRVIKSIIIKPTDFPVNLRITDLEVWRPSLSDFKENRNLLEQ